MSWSLGEIGEGEKSRVQVFPQMLTKMKERGRCAAELVPHFVYGGMRFLFVPKSEMGRMFIGGFDPDFKDLDLAAPIVEGGSFILPVGHWDKDDPEMDCYGLAGLKIEGCSYAHKNGLGWRSSDCPENAVIAGRSNARGCVVYEIDKRSMVSGHDEPFLRVYSSVSGGPDLINEQCAMMILPVLEELVESFPVMRDGRVWRVNGPK